MRYVLMILAIFSISDAVYAMPVQLEAERLERSFLSGNFRQDTVYAIDAAIDEGARQLRIKGFDADANRISLEWQNQYRMRLLVGRLRNVGDHDPVAWIEATWRLLDSALGTELMKVTHLDDLWEFAYTIPVVFYCEDNVDVDEYAKHFNMFAGATAYWVAFAACEAACYGSAFTLVCSPLGNACEIVMENVIAPKIAPKVWDKVCNNL